MVAPLLARGPAQPQTNGGVGGAAFAGLQRSVTVPAGVQHAYPVPPGVNDGRGEQGGRKGKHTKEDKKKRKKDKKKKKRR